MAKASKELRRTLQLAHVVLEVRDSRTPVSARNELLEELIRERRLQHRILLNKGDLSGMSSAKGMDVGPGVPHVVSATQRPRQLKKVLQQAVREVQPAGSTKPVHVVVLGMPNSGKSTVINQLRALHGKRAPRKVGGLPGVTREVRSHRLEGYANPTFLVDSPGIMAPRVRSLEVGLRLAAVGSIRDAVVGAPVIADYVLYFLNAHQSHAYVSHFRLPRPCSSFDALLGAVRRCSPSVSEEDVANRLLAAFRTGSLGPCVLDSLPEAEAPRRAFQA